MEKKYTEIKLNIGCDIETAVGELLKHKEKGELACVNFNGHMLYSDTVTHDSAYLEVVGKTKADVNKQREEMLQSIIRKKEEHQAKIPELTKEWIERGHIILDEKYWNEWDSCVPIRLKDLYMGMELKACLEIVEPLNNGCSLEEAKEIIINQDHSGMSFSLVVAMVKLFCDRGEEFAKFVD